MRRVAKKIMLSIGSQPDIIWSFDPYVFQDPKVFGEDSYVIYHPVDFHFTSLDIELERRANLILTTSEVINNKYRGKSIKKLLIGHGLSDNFKPTPYNSEIGLIEPTKIGLYGNFQRPLDFDTITKCVTKLKNIEFHFIGPFKSNNLSRTAKFNDQLKKLDKYPNTRFHGSIENEKLYSMLRGMDLFIICYSDQINPAAKENPHKIMELLATGKPIVCKECEYYKYNPSLVLIPGKGESFENYLCSLIDNYRQHVTDDKVFERMDYAESHSYRNLLDRVQKKITAG